MSVGTKIHLFNERICKLEVDSVTYLSEPIGFKSNL